MRKFVILGVIVLAIVPFLPRQLALWAGERKASEIVGADIQRTDRTQTVLTLAKWIAAKYEGGYRTVYPAYYRFIPYVTNRRIPEPLRIPPGAIEFLFGDGVCDSAARALGFILQSIGYEAEQLNLVTATGAHSALAIAMPSGKRVYVDPYYGLAAWDGQALDTFEAMLAAIRDGRDVAGVTLPLRDRPERGFYATFAQQAVFSAPQGQDAGIDVALPATQGRVLMLGAVDGSYDDVTAASVRHGLTPYMHYVGSRYDRAWTRTLRAREDVRLEFILTAPADRDLLRSTPEPEIQGNVVAWSLKASDRLVLQDNRTPLRVLGGNF